MDQRTHRVLKDVFAERESADESGGARTIRFVASDESVDRFGDIVSADGWQLGNFKKNPQFLWAHDYRAPIGRIDEIGVEGKRLIARAKFSSEGVSRTTDWLWTLVKEGALRAFSVGFQTQDGDFEPIRDENGDRTGGTRFLKQELLEISLVTVPANPNAVSIARSFNIPEDFIKSVLPLDASVIKRHAHYRLRLEQLKLDEQKLLAPRQATTTPLITR